MTDKPLPSPDTASTASPAGTAPQTSEPVTILATNSRSGNEPPSTARASFQSVLLYYAINFGLLAGLWGISCLILLLLKYKTAEAIGFATVITLVGSFFTRSLIPQLAEKARPSTTPAPQQIDSAREIIETVVFVVVLVLLLKSFTAEAFVIPTGSMAETLWGYQKIVTCPQCGLEFPVNCSQEVDPSDGQAPIAVSSCTCPNCRLDIKLWRPDPRRPNEAMPAQADLIRDPTWRSGDRVLVAKFVYDLLDREPDRLDVVVFRFPGESNFPYTGPVKRHTPMNYIKRLDGKSGETIGIHRGKLWVLSPEKSPKYDDYERAKNDPSLMAQLWRREFLHHDDPRAKELFYEGQFDIVRKKPENLLAMRRLVYDNDHQARDLLGSEKHQRWSAVEGSNWVADGPTGFRHVGNTDTTAWLRYRHLLRYNDGMPQLITDFLGYNAWRGGIHSVPSENWASDLMIECTVKVDKPEGTFVLELSRGTHRYQASFDLKTGSCTLYDLHNDQAPRTMGEAATTMNKAGTYQVRFANMDDRLLVWVDDKLPFGEGITYGPERKLVPTRENDLERPVSIGSRGAKVAVSKLKVYRDTYYTTARGDQPASADVGDFRPMDPATFAAWADAPVSTYYVQPDHYLCLGDNSAESSDGRTWGLVPKRLLLGRALLVYYPFARAGRIR